MSLLRIWTDGCCRTQARNGDGPGGWAFVAVSPSVGVVERQAGDVHMADAGRMELLALVEALGWGQRIERAVEIFSDSHYVVHGFNRSLHNWHRSGWRQGKRKGHRPVRDRDLWQVVWSLSRNSSVKVMKVRRASHVYNVEADQAAKEAMRRAVGPNTRAEQLLMHAIDNSLRSVS
jgi:ribonuclease HI